MMLVAGLAGLWVMYGLFTLWRLAPNDGESAGLDVETRGLDTRWGFEFPGAGSRPPRYPWKLPAEYAIWRWAARLRRPLRPARAAGFVVGSVGVAAGAWWVWQQTASPMALALFGLTMMSPGLMAGLTSATYVPWVSTAWTLGLVVERPAFLGFFLALLRPTAWWQAAWFLGSEGWLLGGFALVAVVFYMAVLHPEVIQSQGWVRWLRRVPTPVQGIVNDGWGYAVWVAGIRYAPVASLAVLAALVGTWRADSVRWLALSVGLFVLTHLPRMLLRPKWAVGYMPEWGVPVVAALAATL